LRDAPPAGAWVYELTDWGKELEPVIIELGRWGARSPALPRDAELSVDSLILFFRTMFDSRAAKGLTANYELRFGDDRFHAEVANQQIAIIEADPSTLAALVYDNRDLAAALRAGALKYEGDKSAVKRFLSLFSLPKRANQ